MAQVNEASILAGGTRIVGKVRSDPGAVRGEGGPHDPRLVIPVSIEMNPQADGQTLALLRLTASLHLDQNAYDHTRIGFISAHDLIDGMPCLSTPRASSLHTVELRFPLTPATTNLIERARHSAQPGSFALYLSLQPTVAWLRNTYGQGRATPAPGQSAESPWGMTLGLHSDLVYFWTTTAQPLRVGVETSAWTDRVLPGMGTDGVRLIELALPMGQAMPLSATREFDAARRALDERRYDDCVIRCRGVVKAWESHLAASKEHRVADQVSERVGWAAGDPRIQFLDSVWKALTDLTNASHHPEGQPAAFVAAERDARMAFMLLAITSEYLRGMEGLR